MTGREVLRALKKAGGTVLREGRRHTVLGCDATKGKCGRCSTTLPRHRGDQKKGILDSIENALEPCLGENWLGRR